MAPSFGDLKERATKAKDASVSKIQNVRDRNTSVPMKKTNWDPYSGQPAPPPPPPRVNANSRPEKPSFPPPPRAANRPDVPPPVNRAPSLPGRSFSTKSSASPTPSPAPAPRPPPRQPASSPVSAGGPPPIKHSTRPGQPSHQSDDGVEPTIDWGNLSAQDKEVFFSWLDEYFSKLLNIEISSRNGI